MTWTSPETVFGAAGALAASGWIALAASPARAAWATRARFYAGRVIPLLLACVYLVLVVRYWGAGGFGSLAEVRALFDVPQLLLAGWLHYLAFDLFVGAWIAERGAAHGLPHLVLLPLLALTFLFGPAGVLAYAVVRGLQRLRRPSMAHDPRS
jgi:hypothetical protein